MKQVGNEENYISKKNLKLRMEENTVLVAQLAQQ